jgi:hypothetical protein
MDTAIAVLTRKSAREIIEAGGSGSWVLNPANAARQRYLVCCRNALSVEFDGEEPHKAAFLVGVIGELVPVGMTRWDQERYRISITECARVVQPGVWRNWRNPVRYTSLEDLGIDVDALEFTSLEEALASTATAHGFQPAHKNVRKLTIAEAKEGLAAMLGISPDAIEIIIRG